jgi:FMN-dependent NADH-azoreductase
MSLFRLDASIRTAGSHSREIADVVEREWRSGRPGAPVVRRDLATDPVPAEAWVNAVGASFAAPADRSLEQQAAVALATEAVDQLVAADVLLFAVPLYNFGVSQHFKAWADLVITDPRMAAGVEAAVTGKPAVLVTVRGGGYRVGTPREGWDHATGWMQRILADVWRLDLRTVESDLTLAEVNPAMADLVPLARATRQQAEQDAAAVGRLLSDRVAA